MEQGTPETTDRHFCSGNNKQGQSREALTYKKFPGYLQMKMLSKHFHASVMTRGQLRSAHCLLVAAPSVFRIDRAIRSAVPIGISPTTVTIISPEGVVRRRETATVGPS